MPYTAPIQKWMSDWADQFDQSCDEEMMRSFVGKEVTLQRPADPESERDAKDFKFLVVGFSEDRLVDPEQGTSVSKWSFLTDEGNQVALFAGTTILV